jgi:hypothetical protein
MYGTKYSLTNYVTGLNIYYTINFYDFLEYTPIYENRVYCNTECCVVLAAASHIFNLTCLLIESMFMWHN